MTARLSEMEIQKSMRGLKDWSRKEGEIQKTYTLRDFKEAMAFVTRVGLMAEAADHHPDIDIRYKRVTLKLSTHSAGGLTRKDFSLAEEIDS